ncbi:hypothetical protein [Candidatus Vampirococcus lugosii]|uniref:DUF350 domain-containing protein n=1 Tax=Candidatus Vampirococcus lugosii TaxID=2789015 RepID=A0ABS5QK05_9BACT|nr:hypothetical protein [Candidatus Vampirococcus lugosii]MBS8121567.1 hypothetical protein [Candidatus Vampirococcus lugosii]
MKKIIILILLTLFLISNTFAQGRFDGELNQSNKQLQNVTDRGIVNYNIEGVRDLIFYVGKDIIIPILILVGIIVAIFGFYKLMFGKDSEEEQKKGISFMVRGTVGILIMISALFITDTVIGEAGTEFEEIKGIDLASQLYNDIAYPFIKIFAYLAVGFLFVILLIQGIKMLTTNQDESAKSARMIFVRNIVGILTILFASEIVQLVYGEGESSINSAGEVGEIGGAILPSETNIGFITTIINWILGFTAFIILIIIIFQTYLLLVKPDDENTLTNLKRNIIYIFIGVLVIGGGFLITNFLLIN